MNCPALYKASKSAVSVVSWVGAAIPRALAGSSPAFHPTTSYAAPAGSGPAGCHRKVTAPLRDSLGRGSSRLGALEITGVGDGLSGCGVTLVAVGLTARRVDVGAGVSVAVGAGVGDGSGVCEAVGVAVAAAIAVGSGVSVAVAVGGAVGVAVAVDVGATDGGSDSHSRLEIDCRRGFRRYAGRFRDARRRRLHRSRMLRSDRGGRSMRRLQRLAGPRPACLKLIAGPVTAGSASRISATIRTMPNVDDKRQSPHRRWGTPAHNRRRGLNRHAGRCCRRQCRHQLARQPPARTRNRTAPIAQRHRHPTVDGVGSQRLIVRNLIPDLGPEPSFQFEQREAAGEASPVQDRPDPVGRIALAPGAGPA